MAQVERGTAGIGSDQRQTEVETIVDVAAPEAKVVRIAVDLAGLAPSVHNTQPWHWTYSNNRLELHSEQSRLLPIADPSGRQLIISCGAALHHLESAFAALSWATDVERFPDGPDSGHLATVHFRRGTPPRPHDFELITAIRRRWSDRRPFRPLGIEHRLPPALSESVRRRGARVTVLSPDAMPALVEATLVAHAALRNEPSYCAELHWWTDQYTDESGIPPGALGTAACRSRVEIGRDFPNGREETTGEENDRSTVLVLSTGSDSRVDWLRSGEALSLVLLEATVRGLSTCPLTHLTEVQQSRDIVRALLPTHDFPEVLVRVGVTDTDPSHPQTPRRPTDAVLSVALDATPDC